MKISNAARIGLLTSAIAVLPACNLLKKHSDSTSPSQPPVPSPPPPSAGPQPPPTPAIPAVVGPALLPLASQSDGSPDVSLVYAYNSDWLWLITFRSGLNAATREALPLVLEWALRNKSAGTDITKWSTLPADTLVVGQLKLVDPSVVQPVLRSIREIELVIAGRADQQSGRKELYVLPMAFICDNASSHVKDLTNTGLQACSISLP